MTKPILDRVTPKAIDRVIEYLESRFEYECNYCPEAVRDGAYESALYRTIAFLRHEQETGEPTQNWVLGPREFEARYEGWLS